MDEDNEKPKEITLKTIQIMKYLWEQSFIKDKYKKPKKTSGSDISFELRITQSHVVNTLKILEDYKLIEFNKYKRIKIITLTETGKKLGENCAQVINLWNENV